ncbi:glycosyl hydrolase family 65 protein, partial [Enterococcus lactis]|uniref:glycosyl hydrolase family 65 protein n=1 Tax=Enterococcus lactis TaxID=357441 RepID=UPI0031CD5BAA
KGFEQMKKVNLQLRFGRFLGLRWSGYSFQINYRELLLLVHVSNEQVTLNLLSREALPLEVYEKAYVLTDHLTIPLRVGEANV